MVKLWKIGWNRIEKKWDWKIQNKLQNKYDKYEKLKQGNPSLAAETPTKKDV